MYVSFIIIYNMNVSFIHLYSAHASWNSVLTHVCVIYTYIVRVMYTYFVCVIYAYVQHDSVMK